jgi:hypothetical protein
MADAAYLQRAVAFQCRGCGQATLVIEEQMREGVPARNYEGDGAPSQPKFEGIFWWPLPDSAPVDKSIPAGIAETYSEGSRCLAARAPSGASVMYRRTIEGIVKDKGSKKAIRQLTESRDLAGAIKIMGNEGALPDAIAEWGEEVRGLGNVGGHLDPFEVVDLEQATDLSKLVRAMLHYLYEEPARLAKLRGSRIPRNDSAS